MAIYDVDEEDEFHFLVIEFVEGETLTHYIPSDAGNLFGLMLKPPKNQKIRLETDS